MKGSNKLTIMAYKNYPLGYTQYVARFSDDTASWNGIRLGDANNNNVEQIRNAAPILAQNGDESASGSCGKIMIYSGNISSNGKTS